MATAYPLGLGGFSCQWWKGRKMVGSAPASPLPEITRAVWGGLGSQPRLPPWATPWRRQEVGPRRLSRGDRPHPYLWRKRDAEGQSALMPKEEFQWLTQIVADSLKPSSALEVEYTGTDEAASFMWQRTDAAALLKYHIVPCPGGKAQKTK